MKFLKVCTICLSVAAMFIMARCIRVIKAAGDARSLLFAAGGCILLAALMLLAIFIIFASDRLREQRIQKEIESLYEYRPKKKKNTSAIFIAIALILATVGGIFSFCAYKRLDTLKPTYPLLDKKLCGSITATVKYQQDGKPYYTFVDGVNEYKALISEDDKDMIENNKIKVRYLYSDPNNSAPDNLFHIADDMLWRAFVIIAAAALFMSPVLFAAAMALFVLDRN